MAQDVPPSIRDVGDLLAFVASAQSWPEGTVPHKTSVPWVSGKRRNWAICSLKSLCPGKTSLHRSHAVLAAHRRVAVRLGMLPEDVRRGK
jgi:hypothetical protein